MVEGRRGHNKISGGCANPPPFDRAPDRSLAMPGVPLHPPAGGPPPRTGEDLSVTDAQSKESDLGVRVASAVVMVVVAGAALWLGGWAWGIFVLLLAIGVLFEWWGLVRKFGISPRAKALWVFGGIFYVGLAAAMMMVLRQASPPLSNDAAWVLLVLSPVIATDIGAYFTGRAIGGPKIAASISPSKTWSGLLGGAFAAAVVMVWLTSRSRIFGDLADSGIPWLSVGFGVAVAVTAQIGDFFESWMKRRAGTKDSGRLIPGHGGLFDRLDGLLAVLFVCGLVMVAAIAQSLLFGEGLLPTPT